MNITELLITKKVSPLVFWYLDSKITGEKGYKQYFYQTEKTTTVCSFFGFVFSTFVFFQLFKYRTQELDNLIIFVFLMILLCFVGTFVSLLCWLSKRNNLKKFNAKLDDLKYCFSYQKFSTCEDGLKSVWFDFVEMPDGSSFQDLQNKAHERVVSICVTILYLENVYPKEIHEDASPWQILREYLRKVCNIFSELELIPGPDWGPYFEEARRKKVKR